SADQVPHSVNLLELPTQIRVLFAKAAVLESAVNHQVQLFHKILGLQDVVECSHLEGLNRGFRACEGGEKDELAAEACVAELTQKVDTGHVFHLDVRNDEIDFGGLHVDKAVLSAGGAGYFVALLLQEDFEQFPNGPFIVNDKNLGSFRHHDVSVAAVRAMPSASSR